MSVATSDSGYVLIHTTIPCREKITDLTLADINLNTCDVISRRFIFGSWNSLGAF